MNDLLTEKTKDSFFFVIGEFLDDRDRYKCGFFDYEKAEEIHSRWSASGEADIDETLAFSKECTSTFWEAFRKFILHQQKKTPVGNKTHSAITITIKAQRLIAAYCLENRCDTSTAIITAFSAEVAAPVLSESDTKIADEVVRALYEKIGKRLAKIEETMFIVEKDRIF